MKKRITRIIESILERLRWYRFRRLQQYKMLRLINADKDCLLTQQAIDLMKQVGELVQPDGVIRRGGRVVYTIPTLKETTFYAVMRCRELMQAGDMRFIDLWCDGYEARKVGDVLVIAKHIQHEIERAARVQEEHLSDGEPYEAGDAIDESIAMFNALQIVAEQKRITTDEAQKVLYYDAIFLLIKYKRENDRRIREARRERAGHI